jgi:hypothetical protein
MYRLKVEFTLEQIIDTLRHPKRVEPATGLLGVITAFTRPLRFLPLCVPTQTGSSRVSGRICGAPVRNYTRWSVHCRSSPDALRPAEIVFHSLKYCYWAHRIYEAWGSLKYCHLAYQMCEP